MDSSIRGAAAALRRSQQWSGVRKGDGEGEGGSSEVARVSTISRDMVFSALTLAAATCHSVNATLATWRLRLPCAPMSSRRSRTVVFHVVDEAGVQIFGHRLVTWMMSLEKAPWKVGLMVSKICQASCAVGSVAGPRS